MSLPHIHLAIVGHTNTGKTSLVRTLLYHRGFGVVRDEAGTTRAIQQAQLMVGKERCVTLYDSPGLENAPALFDWLETHAGQSRHRGPDRIRVLLDDVSACQRFYQEAESLRLLLASDLALYVCDVREPVLEKYQDELSILGLCGRPIIIVLNFVKSPRSNESEWRATLAALGHHHIVAFDAVVRDPVSERRILDQAKIVIERFVPTLDAWIAQRHSEESERFDVGIQAIASLLVDVADRQYIVGKDASMENELAVFQSSIRAREQATVDLLLDLYRFGPEDYQGEALNLTAGRWRDDLFSPDTLKQYGIQAGRYMGTGAGIGAAFDVATGGLSLGTGTLIGAVTGAGISAIQHVGGDLMDRWHGRVRLVCDVGTLRLLTWRQMRLLSGLRQRGHASQEPLTIQATDLWSNQPLPKSLKSPRLDQDTRINRVGIELAKAFEEVTHQ